MNSHPDDQTAESRQQRLDALRGLAREAAPVTSDAPPALPTARPLRNGWRRWLAPVSALVIILLIVGVVVGAILRQGGLWPLGQHTRPAPALTSKAYSLGPNSCPSTPTWSPDGKSLALLVTPQPNLSTCFSTYSITSIAQINPAVNGGESNDTTPNYAILILDAATGHITRTIALPTITAEILCMNASVCSIQSASPVSVGWSPDGKTVAAFFTYVYDYSDNIRSQNGGVLIVVPADGSGAPRLFLAQGRVRYSQNASSVSLDQVWGPDRFTWNLTTGAATSASVHRAQFVGTTPFAPGYQLGADGALTLDQQAQAGARSPWQEGVLLDTQGPGVSTPVYSWQASQWLWSADGRYVTPNLDTGAYISVPGVTGAPPAPSPGLIGETTASPPDAATNQSVKAVAKLGVSAALARNPDGKLLATYNCGVSTGELAIRAVASGATVAHANYTYPLTNSSLGCSGDISAITWSPDGARIATVDAPDSQLIIWRVNLHA